ncbi:MAG: cohesin domain-containing protein [Methanosarcinales archaeon]
MKKLKETCLIVVTAVMLCIFAQPSAATSTISVEPAYTYVWHGDEFTVNITVDPAENEVLYGASYTLYFNKTLLNATSQTQGPFLSQDGEKTNVFVNEINNNLGRIEYAESRMGTLVGVNSSGVLTTITFQANRKGISQLNLRDLDGELLYSTAGPIQTYINNGRVAIAIAPTPFLIHGQVSYENNTPCNNPTVNITNLNTSEEWQAETHAENNCYRLMLVYGMDIAAGDILQFNVKSIDGSHFNTTDYTITQEDINLGGVFNFNFTTVRTGDVNCDGDVNMGDLILLLNNLSHPAEYPICNRWVGDVNCDDTINMEDVRSLLNHVGDPDRYPLECGE